jgi:hypothetical protein
VATETFTNAYLLSENKSTGAFTTTEQIAGSATITDPNGSVLSFGDPVIFQDSYNTITLLYDGPVFENGKDIGFAAVDPSTGSIYMFTDGNVPANTNLVIETGDPTTICFVQGTAIATPSGLRSVEDLESGDMVCTADGGVKAVKWVGRQSVVPGPAVPSHVLPVRISAGALGDNLPVRDLLVSQDHALMLDGALVHARALVNGTTIVMETAAFGDFTYYHLEMADHALVLAEGVAAETYVDRASRLGFDNYAEFEQMHADSASVPHMDCPRVKSQRQLPYTVRARLARNDVAMAA